MTTDTAPRTGASPAQIEAAIGRMPGAATMATRRAYDRWADTVRHPIVAAARYLVPETDAIVPRTLIERAAAAVGNGDILPALRAELLAAIGDAS